MLGEAGDAHGRGMARRIHLRDIRREQEIGTRRFQPRAIGRLVARIGGEILVGAELCRIDEERDDDAPAIGLGLSHERQMTVMQGAHGWHQADAVAGAAPGRDLLTQLGHAAERGDPAGHRARWGVSGRG
jgi:hypothetical protein